MKPAKIVKLDIENVMRIRAAHIEPGGNVVILGGRNAQGKTSVLDSISMAIGGMKLCPDMPIREGESEASIQLQLGEMHVTRKFKKDANGRVSSSLSVKNAAGQPLSPPQETLNALIGRLAFDPLEFARMSPADARETLRALVGLDVEQLEDEQGRVYRTREEAGRAKRAAQAVVDDMPVPGECSERVQTEPITAKMAAANQGVAEFEERRGVYSKHRDEEIRLHAAIAEVEANLERLKTALVVEERLSAQASDSVDTFIMPDFDQIKETLDAALSHNQCVDEFERARELYQRKVDEALVAATTWKDLDTKHNQIVHDIKQRTEAVEYPIADLELRKEGVFYQGVPFEQGSRAEKIKVSLAMGMAMNDKLRILLIRDGSVLDADSMGIIHKLAEKHDFQFWIEMARGYEGAAGAVVIEDGGVVE